jgi:hypothetical protein
MPGITDFAPHPSPSASTENLLKAPRMAALMLLQKLLPHFSDPALALQRLQRLWRLSINNLFRSIHQIPLLPSYTGAVPPFNATQVAELPPTFTTAIVLVIKCPTCSNLNIRHVVAAPIQFNKALTHVTTLPSHIFRETQSRLQGIIFCTFAVVEGPFTMATSLIPTVTAHRPVAFGNFGRRDKFCAFRVAAVRAADRGEFHLSLAKYSQLFLRHNRRDKIQTYLLATASWREESLVLR